MKTLLTLTLAVLMAGAALAQGEDAMGVFFDDASFVNETTNADVSVGLLASGYVVLLNPSVESVGAYEVGMTLSDPSAVFVTSVTGPNGWTNFGSFVNHIAGFASPVPVVGGAAVLSEMTFLVVNPVTVEISFGAAEPSSFDGQGPGIADGADPENLVLCQYTTCPDLEGLVGTLNGPGVTLCDVVAHRAGRGLHA